MPYQCANPSCDLCGEVVPEKLARRHDLHCESCGTTLGCTETAGRSIPTGATAPGDIGRRVIERFPFPVAYGYRKVVEVESALRAEESVFFTYNALLRFGTLVFLGQFLESNVQNPHAAKAIRCLKNPCLANWHTALITLAKHLFPPPANGLPFPAFGDGGPFSAGMVQAARNLSRLKHDGVSIHDRLRLARNECWGHGTIREEEQAARRLPELRALLEKVLGLFSPLADIQLLRRSPNGMIRLVGAGEPFIEEPVLDARLEDLFDESETVLRGPGGDLLPLYPLFLSPEEPQREGYIEPLLVFDGHSKEAAVYLGVRSRAERRDTLERYRELLRAKDIDPRFTLSELQPWTVAQWAREETRTSVENLKDVKYFPTFYQERRREGARSRPQGHPAAPTAAQEDAHGVEEQEDPVSGVDDAVERWLDFGPEPALIVAAEAGAGKTSLFCRVAEKLLGMGAFSKVGPEGAADEGDLPMERRDAPDCVLLLLGGGVRGHMTLFERVRDGLGFTDAVNKGAPERFDQLLDAWSIRGEQLDLDHERRRLVLLVDAVNEADDPKALFEELSHLAATAATYNRKLGRRFVRLLVSVRAERIETLVERWHERHDTPFLEHPQNFAHFDDPRGKRVPYLALRRFTPEEAGRAYERARGALPASCPATWEWLSPATRQLLRHPLLVLLFHRAYAGTAEPAAAGTAEAVWGQWLDRTFSPEQGGQELEQNALALADACLDGGHARIPVELAAQWRAVWQAKQGNDPIRIAAGLDPMERLAEAGFLRDAEAGGLDWVSDSLAEQVYFRALRRRDPHLTEESLATWVALPRTPRCDDALVRAGVEVWRSGRSMGLRPFLDVTDDRRARMLLGQTLTRVVPRGPVVEVAAAAEKFGEALGELTAWAVQGGNHQRCKRLRDTLAWEVGQALADHWGTTPVLSQIHRKALGVAGKLAAMEPENTQYQHALSVSYGLMGNMAKRTNPAKAREWYEMAFGIHKELAVVEPENTQYQRSLSVSYGRMGGMAERTAPAKAREWYEKALGVAEKLAAMEPENTQYQHDLSMWYGRMGGMAERTDPAMAREWYEKALGVAEKLATMEPENTQYQRPLSVLYGRMGNMAKRTAPAKAREWYEKALGVAEKLAAMEPENTQYQHDLSVLYGRMGNMAKRTAPAMAREWYEKALIIREKLVAMEPENTQCQRALSVSYEKALGIAEQFAAMEPKNTKYRRDVDELYGRKNKNKTKYQRDLAKLYCRMGAMAELTDPAKACEWIEKALWIKEKLAAMKPANTPDQCSLSVSYRRMGCLAERTDPARAREWYEKALGVDERLAAMVPDDPDFQYHLAFTLARLGRIAEALAALTRSVELGNADADATVKDSDLRSLWGMPEFELIVARMRANGGGHAAKG